MKEHNTFRPSRYRCKLKFRYFCWPGAERIITHRIIADDDLLPAHGHIEGDGK